MKIRRGFVSNSSSSSFVAWGVSEEKIISADSLYLVIFNKELKYYNALKKENPEWDAYRRLAKDKHDKMLSINTDAEKILYAKENLEIDKSLGDFEQGGQENDFVGITISTMLKNHPDIKFGDIKTFVAIHLNESYGTNFTTDDISCREEGWYDG